MLFEQSIISFYLVLLVYIIFCKTFIDLLWYACLESKWININKEKLWTSYTPTLGFYALDRLNLDMIEYGVKTISNPKVWMQQEKYMGKKCQFCQVQTTMRMKTDMLIGLSTF